MSSQQNDGLGNKPIIVILGLIASCLAIFVFLTGKESLPEIFDIFNGKSTSTPSVISTQAIVNSPETEIVATLPIETLAFPTTTNPTSNPTSNPPSQLTSARINTPNPAPLGWTYEQDGVQLTLIKSEIRTESDSAQAALHLWFALVNKSPDKILIEYDLSQIYVIDSRGERYTDWDGNKLQTFYIESGQSNIFDRYYTLIPGQQSRMPLSSLPATVYVDRFSRIENMKWLISDSPNQNFKTYDEVSPAGKIGTVINIDGFDVTLSNFEIRTLADSASAAFHASITVANNTGQKKLLELDYGNFYVEDNWGTRYIDIQGFGLYSTWIEPGNTHEFDRYYSIAYDTESRVPIGTIYVIFACEGIGNATRALWRINIVR